MATKPSRQDNAKAARKDAIKASPSKAKGSEPYVPGPIRPAPAPKPVPVASLSGPHMDALAAAVRAAGKAPAASAKEGREMYAAMIDTSTPETRAATTRNAAEAARNDAERLDGLADEFLARSVEFKNKGMFGAAHLQHVESSKCRDTADTRRGMAMAYDQAADEFAAERAEGVA